ncbi:hypothetical protein HU200_028790 [Digitaria exilis]|uniref:Uncharacterized protein n=1 Tax=Digitaria exilis TaxID=1010633 RepID=A0A835C0B1_9POAL|nr:hypothetical protein HU200_028790 [Digitaria exilis]CAB3482267.1 unnamed protein product [Digitaria exilis]
MSLSELQERARFVQSSAASAGVNFDEERWLRRVQRSMEKEAAEALGAAAKVFDVPRVLRQTRPEAYLPQHFALGPYHCNKPELRDMERYKLAAAKRAEKLFADGQKFEHLVQRLLLAQDKMRAPYHRFLELSDQTLAWMMAIDTCFLLDFLESYHRDEVTDMVSSATNWINATVRDAMMLENQLPLFLFSQALALRHPTADQAAAAAADALHAVLGRFIKEVSPIKTTAELVVADVAKHAHMLELLYHFLVPDASVFDDSDSGDREPPPMVPEEFTIDMLDPSQHLPDYDKVKQACVQVSSLDMAPVRFLKKNLITRPMSVASSLPGTIMRKVPVLSAVAPLVTKLLTMTSSSPADVESKLMLKGVSLGSIIVNSPLAQEIMIPSVSTLARWGIRFVPAPEGIAGISFDAAAATLSLPIITLDANTEVVLRNLVAYEAVAVRGALVLARYTELMNGIIDTAKDVKILRQSGVVVNRLKSDKEAADMWNGMCRATRLSKVPRLDAAIREVNAHRSRRAAARAQKLLKKYVFRSWRILTLLAAVVLLLMTAMQTFCSVYPCNRWFGSVFQLPQAGGNR